MHIVIILMVLMNYVFPTVDYLQNVRECRKLNNIISNSSLCKTLLLLHILQVKNKKQNK